VVEEVLDEFPELRRLLDRPGGALSGGEQQLLALARALCGRPRLLLLDEPTEGIQPSINAAIVERIHALRQRGLSVLLVEQNLDFIEALADRILLIQRGRITREIPPTALGDPALVQEFVGTSA
jgi:ABC-type branched-subunit amino acid transport system ATPase component